MPNPNPNPNPDPNPSPSPSPSPTPNPTPNPHQGAPTGIVNVIDGEAGAINRADLAAFCLDTILDPDFAYIR